MAREARSLAFVLMKEHDKGNLLVGEGYVGRSGPSNPRAFDRG
jgi:hypothetical protein